MWFWSIFKLLSDSLIKPEMAACGVKSESQNLLQRGIKVDSKEF